MLKIGLTGGIASGKSTVARMFEALGAALVDTDVVARQVVEPGEPALAEVRAAFGEEVIDASGRLDRGRLRDRVFAAADARKRLEGILHPRIRARVLELLASLESCESLDSNRSNKSNVPPESLESPRSHKSPESRRSHELRRSPESLKPTESPEVTRHLAPPYAIVVVPLLVETGFGALVDRVLVVDCPVEIQRRRLLARAGIGEREADAMIAAQVDRQTRLDAADDVVDNSGDIAVTREQVERLHERYLSLSSDVCRRDPPHAE